jgi:hypothetical protein
MRTTIVLAALGAATFWYAASAGVITYNCKGRVVKLDDAAMTLVVDGHLYPKGHMGEGCRRFSVEATDEAGSTAELCTATKGYADLTIMAKGKKLVHVECQMKR